MVIDNICIEYIVVNVLFEEIFEIDVDSFFLLSYKVIDGGV